MPRRHRNAPRKPASSQSNQSTSTVTSPSNNQPDRQPEPAQSNSQPSTSTATEDIRSTVTDTFTYNQSHGGIGDDMAGFEDLYFECVGMQVNATLASKPFVFASNARVLEISIGGADDGDLRTMKIKMKINKVLSGGEIRAAMTPDFHSRLLARITAQLQGEYMATFQSIRLTTRSVAAQLSSRHTRRTHALPIKWTVSESDPWEMYGVIRSAQCLEGREDQWNTFISQMNECIAAHLPRLPVEIQGNNNAKQVILSNDEGKLRITIKFSRPCPPVNAMLILYVEKSLITMLIDARRAWYNQHCTAKEKDPECVAMNAEMWQIAREAY